MKTVQNSVDIFRKHWKQLNANEESINAMESNENNQETKPDYVRNEKPALCKEIIENQRIINGTHKRKSKRDHRKYLKNPLDINDESTE